MAKAHFRYSSDASMWLRVVRRSGCLGAVAIPIHEHGGVFVAARFSSAISACSSRHRSWPSYCDVLAFEVSVGRIGPSDVDIRPASFNYATLGRRYGCSARTFFNGYIVSGLRFIDPQRVQQWREKHDQRVGSDDSLTVHQGARCICAI